MDRTKLFLRLSADLLRSGKPVRFQAMGKSMGPTILDGEAITVEPAGAGEVKVGDIVFYHGKRGALAHRVVGIERRRGRREIYLVRGDAPCASEEPVERWQIDGKVAAVERRGRIVRLDGTMARLFWAIRFFSARLRGWIAWRMPFRGVNRRASVRPSP